MAGVDLGKWVARCRDAYWEGHLSPTRVDALNAVDGWTWGRSRRGSWRFSFAVLDRFHQTCGATVLCEKYRFEGIDLQAWTFAQRDRYAAGRLSSSQVEHFDRLTDWEWDIQRARWRQGLAVAIRYAQFHSLADVQENTRLGDFPIGRWVRSCRRDYRVGAFTSEQIIELESIPGWSWGRLGQHWRRGCEALHQYVASTGHACPPQNAVVDGVKLGRWVSEKRRQYRRGALPQSWAVSLESLPGWEWDPQQTRWRHGLEVLTDFAAEYGHAHPGASAKFAGYPVGDWVRAQRNARQHNALPLERAALLQALPGWRWTTRESE